MDRIVTTLGTIAVVAGGLDAKPATVRHRIPNAGVTVVPPLMHRMDNIVTALGTIAVVAGGLAVGAAAAQQYLLDKVRHF